MDFLRSKKTASSLQNLQAAYEESYQASLRAITAEAQKNPTAALSAWKTTKRIISLQLSTITDTPKTAQESQIMSNIMEIDRQCYDRITFLERNLEKFYQPSNPSSSVSAATGDMPKPAPKRPPKSDSSLPESWHSKPKGMHRRAASEVDASNAYYHSAASIDGRSSSIGSVSPPELSRTPSPQQTITNPRSMLHTLRSSKSGMGKLIGERKAASNAATLAWSVKQSNVSTTNAHNALTAASLSTGNLPPPRPQTSNGGKALVQDFEKMSLKSSTASLPVKTRVQTTSAPKAKPSPTARQVAPRPRASRAQTTPVPTAKPVKRTTAAPNSKPTKPKPRPKKPVSEPSESEDETDQWLKEARKKVSKVKGIDEHAAEQIFNDVVVKGDPVYWDDIAGLEKAKTSLKETVVYPFLRPDLFSGLREPAQGMLLFGPPGTGKTMLARAVAQESHSTFFSISASSLTSKYLGESEKLVRALFLMARALAPSIIFVDEIDSLLSVRSDSGEHETSRRIKTEFLVQWSALQHAAAGKDHEDVSRVLVLAATNLPWVIDEAARRRFVRRQYIPLPEPETRAHHMDKLLSRQKNAMTDKERAKLVELTDGFSGSDLTALAKDAAMGPLRSLGDALLTTPTDQIRPIGFEDFQASLQTIRPSVSKEGLKVFEDWAGMYGSSGA